MALLSNKSKRSLNLGSPLTERQLAVRDNEKLIDDLVLINFFY